MRGFFVFLSHWVSWAFSHVFEFVILELTKKSSWKSPKSRPIWNNIFSGLLWYRQEREFALADWLRTSGWRSLVTSLASGWSDFDHFFLLLEMLYQTFQWTFLFSWTFTHRTNVRYSAGMLGLVHTSAVWAKYYCELGFCGISYSWVAISFWSKFA